jgi:hypothetical protein
MPKKTRVIPYAILLIVVVWLIFFRGVIFQDMMFAGPDVLAGGAVFDKFGDDVIAIEGHYPHWNPYVFCGMPSLGSMSYTRYLYPGDWVVWLLQKITAGNLPRLFWLVLHYLAGGLFMYLLIRELGGNSWGAAFGGIAFMITPHLVGLATIGHGGKALAMTLLPLVFWSMIRLQKRISLMNFGLASLAIGLEVLGKHVQVAYYCLLAVMALLVWNFVWSLIRKESPRRVLTFVAAGVGALVLGFLISSVLYLPVQEYSAYSTRGGVEGGTGFEYATAWSFHPKEIGTFIVPSLFGLKDAEYWGEMPFQQVTHYMGLLPLALAIGILFVRRDRFTVFFAVLAGGAVLIAFGRHFEPLFRLLYELLPQFKKFRVPSMALILTQVSIPVLAGLGLSRLFSREGRGKSDKVAGGGVDPSKRLAMVVAVILAAFIVFSLIVKAAEGPIAESARASLAERGRQDAVPSSQTAASMAGNDAMRAFLIGLLSLGLIALPFRRGLISAQNYKWLLIVGAFLILLGDLWTMNSRFTEPVPASSLADYFREDRYVRFLKSQPEPFRFLEATRGGLSTNRWMYHRVQTIGGYQPAKLKVYDDLMREVNLFEERMLNFLNVRYVLAQQELPEDRFRQVMSSLYMSENALPRAFLVGKARLVEDEAVHLSLMADRSLDLSEEVLLFEDPGPLDEGSTGTAEITEYRTDRVVVKTNASGSCLLVLTDVYYPPGWRALVDGSEAPILRADYAFRAVHLSPGSHTVEFVSVKRSFRTGLAVSLISGVLSVGMILAGLLLERRAGASVI